MLRVKPRHLACFTAPFALLAFIVFGSGCTPTPAGARSDPVSAAGDGVAGIEAHTQSAQRHVDSAMPHANPTGKVYLTAATGEHQAVFVSASAVRSALIEAQVQARTQAESLSDARHAYEKLEHRWFVVWGRRIEHLLWVVGISWLVLGIASVVLGMGNPLSWSQWLGREIVRLVPLMNPFSWLRDWLTRRREQSTAK